MKHLLIRHHAAHVSTEVLSGAPLNQLDPRGGAIAKQATQCDLPPYRKDSTIYSSQHYPDGSLPSRPVGAKPTRTDKAWTRLADYTLKPT